MRENLFLIKENQNPLMQQELILVKFVEELKKLLMDTNENILVISDARSAAHPAMGLDFKSS